MTSMDINIIYTHNPNTPLNATIVTSFAALIFIAIIILSGKRPPLGSVKKTKKKYYPIIATKLDQVINFNKLHDFMVMLSNKHPTFRQTGLCIFRDEIFTSDPQNVEYILKTNFSNYGKGLYHYTVLNDLLGDGVFTVDGEKWKVQRKIASYQFSTKIVKDFSTSVFKTNAVKLAQIVSQAAKIDQVLNMTDLFMKSTLETVFKVVLGVEMDSLFENYEEAIRFSHAFDEANEITFHRYIDLLWKIKRFLNIGSEAVLRNHIKLVDDLVYKVIKIKFDEISNKPTNKGDVLSRLVNSGEKDMKYLKDMVLSFIIAGKDTTATTMSWFFYMLSKHPDIQDKIAYEVSEATNSRGHNDSSVEQLVASLTEEAINKMPYLLAALNETLRLYPAIPLDGKFCFSDDTLPDGYSVRKGDVVAYCPYVMGRMKFLWGDDAEEFKPDRWIDGNGLFRPESPFKLTAFQAGPRICLGKDFAYRQMMIFSAVLLGSYKFTMSEKGKQVHYKTMLNLRMDGGLHLIAYER